jgi:RNA polymerase sigma-70 factor (ECF subfamily)
MFSPESAARFPESQVRQVCAELSRRLRVADSFPSVASHADYLADAEPTHSGSVVGTPAYLAPEQASGRPGRTSVRCDCEEGSMTDASVNKGRGESTSLSLLERARRKEPGAWDKVVTLYTPLVYSWCRKARVGPADAEDIGQEVFRAVLRKLADFHRDQPGDSFRGWLRRITANKILDHRRRHPRHLAAMGGSDALKQMAELPAEAPGALEDVLETADTVEETRLLLRQALKQLEPQFKEQTWQAFWRVRVGGQSPADVARELGTSVNAVYLAGSRVLRRLREEFAEVVDPPPGESPEVLRKEPPAQGT